MPDDDTMITIRHEDGNTLRGTVEQVLSTHLAKGWKLDAGPERRAPETERPAEQFTDAQVEAAARAYFNLSEEWTPRVDNLWDSLPEDGRESLRKQTRRALEAAWKAGITTDAPKPARPAEPQEGDTLEGLIRAMVPIKHEPLATNVVNEWLERIRAVLDEGVVWEYAIKLPPTGMGRETRYTVPDYDLEATRARLKTYDFWPNASLVRRRAVAEWEEIA